MNKEEWIIKQKKKTMKLKEELKIQKEKRDRLGESIIELAKILKRIDYLEENIAIRKELKEMKNDKQYEWK